MHKLYVILAACVFVGVSTIGVVSSETRVALIIGNSAYTDAPIPNPVNDATDMASALRKLGFNVTLKTDANQRTIEEAVRSFGKKLRKGGVGLFYYAGHGLQINGRNYLIPIGASIETESEAKYEAVDAGRVLGQMEDAGNNLNIIILDACRNNPFAKSFRSAEKGLAKMDAPTGSILAYATSPGSVAADGSGKNGLYTEKLLWHMQTPGMDLPHLFMQVRKEVVAATERRQVPWESSSLIGDFYFVPGRGIEIVRKAPEREKTDSITEIPNKPNPKSVTRKMIGNSIGQEFVYVSPGTFTMGSTGTTLDRGSFEEQHQVTLTNSFYIQTTEVTQGQWRAVMGENPSIFNSCGEDCPVENVSWRDVQKFIQKLNKHDRVNKYRLPTEAEWEYTARAGSTHAFANGDISLSNCSYDTNLNAIGWYCGNSERKTHPVGQKLPNAWGLYDTHGNVSEYCQDYHDTYPTNPVTNPTGPKSGSSRINRGGNWKVGTQASRLAFRGGATEDYRSSGFGFRLALTPVASDRPIKSPNISSKPMKTQAKEVGRDRHFITYSNNTVVDTKTGLMWAAVDSQATHPGPSTTWSDAKSYCDSLELGGYTDWRLPTASELLTLYNPSRKTRHGFHVATPMIEISGYFPWTAEHEPTAGKYVSMLSGKEGWASKKDTANHTAVPVRSEKKIQ